MSDKEMKTELLQLLRRGEAYAAMGKDNAIVFYYAKHAPQWVLANALSAEQVQRIQASRKHIEHPA